MSCSFSSPNTNHSIVKVVAGLYDMFTAVRPIAWLHEPSHEGLPFNEFADIAAKWQTKHTTIGHTRSPASLWATSEPDAASWASLYAAGSAVKRTYPIKEISNEI